jgi:hypothetical protein
MELKEGQGESELVLTEHPGEGSNGSDGAQGESGTNGS